MSHRLMLLYIVLVFVPTHMMIRCVAQSVPSNRLPFSSCDVVNPVHDLDLLSFVSVPWYVQQQQPIPIVEPTGALYCVKLEYSMPQGILGTVQMSRYANMGEVSARCVSHEWYTRTTFLQAFAKGAIVTHGMYTQ